MEQREQREQRQQWEYKRVWWEGGNDGIEGELNRLGAEGWELITMVFGGAGPTFLFKRPKLAQNVPSA